MRTVLFTSLIVNKVTVTNVSFIVLFELDSVAHGRVPYNNYVVVVVVCLLRMSKQEKRLSFNKHLSSPVDTVLNENVIDMRLLNRICLTSGIECHATRGVAWRLMLGYLPLEKDTWHKKVSC